MEGARSKWERLPAVDWLEEHRLMIDDVRAALDWAFSPDGDAALGVSLTVAAVPLWFQLSLVTECCNRVESALAAPPTSRNAQAGMALYAAQAWTLMQTRGSIAKTRTSWNEVLRIAESLGDVDYQLRAIWGLWAGLLNASEFRQALALAQRFYELAETTGHSDDLPVGDRMIGYILHLLGDQRAARGHIERMLRNYIVPVAGSRIIRFVFDQKITARCFLARILWLQGQPDQAFLEVNDIVEVVAREKDPLSLCQALVQAACPVSLFIGDLDKAEGFIDVLLELSARDGLDFWQAYGHGFQGALLVKRGATEQGLALLTTALSELRELHFGVYYNYFLGEFAEACALAGHVDQGLAAIDEALRRSEHDEGRWCSAELLRLKGTILLRTPAAKQAESWFLKALDIARRQQTLSWELRAAMSLCRLWRDRRAGAKIRDLLLPIYERFTEGFDTPELREARDLLNAHRR
jgi:tetratricopeptide (TPR) repeat protein